jgi:RNA polymerase sigma-70 factor (ECF subfamily)
LDPLLRNIHEDLIARCKAGDQQAHFQVYKLYSKAMYNTAWRVVGNEAEAQDVLQEAFTSAFRHLEYYRGDASFGSWLKRIVVNKALNVIQKRRFERMPEDEDWDVAEEEVPADYADSLTVDRVKRGIGELPDGYRAVLSLYLLEGYDHQEISEIMNISESTSKSQLNRAKARLRDWLAQNTNKPVPKDGVV